MDHKKEDEFISLENQKKPLTEPFFFQDIT